MRRWFQNGRTRGRSYRRRILLGESLERREVLAGNGFGGGVEVAPVRGPMGPGPTGCETAQVCQQNTAEQRRGNAGQGTCLVVTGELDAQETLDLLHMREEEKLARDVYQAMYAKYGVAIFNKIAASESRHMEAVGKLIVKYGLEDPVGDNPAGVFENDELQALYDSLIAQGEQSLADAYQVGIEIEKLDIADLQKAIVATDNADVKRVYRSLLAGSQNHLAAFTAASQAVDGQDQPIQTGGLKKGPGPRWQVDQGDDSPLETKQRRQVEKQTIRRLVETPVAQCRPSTDV